MNARQYSLLQLVKEIDAFCKEHDITYYCAAGTVLGAIRHGGFIPWDDDIDILMTRREFNKFTEAFQQYGPKDRTVEYYEGNHEHHSTVPRFIREGSSMFCHYHITGYAAAGILIDIFILDPLPDGHLEQEKYLADFYAYADLIAPTLSYSNRLPENYFDVIENCEKRVPEEGLDSVAERLSDKLFSYKEENCSRFILRWGSTPFIYPKEMFGEPFYMQFEDISIPVPSQWARYLAIHYGITWTDIPYEEGMATHSSVFSTSTDYHELYLRRDRLFSQSELIDLHNNMKIARRYSEKLYRPLEKYAADLQIRKCLLEIEKGLRSAGCNSAALYENKQYSELIKIYRSYIDLQTSIYFMGAAKHGSAYRWLFPVIIPLDDSVLSYLLMSLIYTGKTNIAEKIISLHRRAGALTDSTTRISDLISKIQTASGAYYSGNISEALSVISGISDYAAIPDLLDLYWLSSVRCGLSFADAAVLKSMAQDNNATHGIQKAYADWLWDQGDKNTAETIYRSVMESCRNGMFLKDIHEKGLTSVSLSSRRTSHFEEDDISRCIRHLFEEIFDICAEAGIQCVPCRDLTQRICNNEPLIYDAKDPELLITANNAKAFIDAFASINPQGKLLLSWKDGDNIKGLALRYVASDSLNVDLRHPEDWQNGYLGVTIRILRSSDAGKLHIKYTHRAETVASLIGSTAPTGTKGLKKAAFRMLTAVPESVKGNWRRHLFTSALNSEASPTGDYYYYSYGNGIRPKKQFVPSSVLRNTVIKEYFGRTYPLSKEYVDSLNEADKTSPRGHKVSLFLLQSTSVSVTELLSAKDYDNYLHLPWRKWRMAEKETSSYDKEVRKVWLKMRDAALELIG